MVSADVSDKLKGLPKGDVHVHLHLSAGKELLKEAYPGLKLEVPGHFHGYEGMMQFIQHHVNALMNSAKDVVTLMDLAIRSSMADNVTYLEASVDIGLARYFNNSLNGLLEAVNQLKVKYRGQQIDFRPEIGMKKDSPSEIINEAGVQCIESGIFDGIDIYGRETEANLGAFQSLFKFTKSKKLKTKVHIGEFSSHATIENAIELLEPDEIQHGISASGSEYTMRMIRERGIRLNVCPQSNIALGAVASLNEHPIRKLYDSGILLTINTDDYLLFNATLTQQYKDLIEHQIFSFEEIDEIRTNALPRVQD